MQKRLSAVGYTCTPLRTSHRLSVAESAGLNGYGMRAAQSAKTGFGLSLRQGRKVEARSGAARIMAWHTPADPYRPIFRTRRAKAVPRGPRGEKRPADVIGNAVKVMRIATGEEVEEAASTYSAHA